MTNCAPFRGILYIFDSLRYDYLGCNGHPSSVTPNIDKIAQDGMRAKKAYAQAIWTYPSAGSIFTGLYPERHKSQQFNQKLGDSHPHIGEVFTSENITTACFSTTLGVSPERGFGRGFDEFYHLGSDDAGLRPDIMDELNQKLLPWVEEHAESGFFAVIWAMGTHHPYVTPTDVDDPTHPLGNEPNVKGTQAWMRELPKEQVDEIRTLYRSTVEYSDKKFGELLKKLYERGVYRSTNVIVTSDHGEIFDEHARLEHSGPVRRQILKTILGEERCRYYGVFDSSGFIGHQGIHPYNELIHVPLIMKTSDQGPDLPAESDCLIEHTDLLPTYYDLADQEGQRMDGKSIIQLILGDQSRDYTFSTSQLHGGNLTYRSVSADNKKLCTREFDFFELRDILSAKFYQSLFGYFIGQNSILLDQDESTIIQNQSALEELRGLLSEHIEKSKMASDSTQQNIDIDEETKDNLRELGYR